MDTYRGRVFSKFFSIGSFTLVIPSALILGLVPKDSAVFRSGPLLGTLWFLAFAATCFFSCALLYIASFRRFGVGTEKLNCFDIIWIDPFDPSRCLPAGQWRALTVFLSMSVVVNLLIFFFIDRRAIGFDGIKSLPFFLFWGNVLYGAGLIFEIFRILKEEKTTTLAALEHHLATIFGRRSMSWLSNVLASGNHIDRFSGGTRAQ